MLVVVLDDCVTEAKDAPSLSVILAKSASEHVSQSTLYTTTTSTRPTLMSSNGSYSAGHSIEPPE